MRELRCVADDEQGASAIAAKGRVFYVQKSRHGVDCMCRRGDAAYRAWRATAMMACR